MELFKLIGKIAIENTEANKAIDDTVGKTEKSQSKISNAFSKVGGAAVKVGKVVGVGLAAGAGAITALAKKALGSYADYEQLVGGIETLFTDSSNKVMEYANNAYKTAGMSANDYMETVTSFSASLIQSLGGDTAKAAEKANLAIVDMSDNANKMGTSMEMIQNAYQGFAKQNYTMLDNLKLGYGGTQEEMQRLLEDAKAISGIEYDISSYADIVDAIHVIQTEMGITGTTAKEAGSTISGSLSSMKSAWQNLVAGLGNENIDLSGLIDRFVDSVGTVADNVIPRIEVILNGVSELIVKIVPKIADKLPAMIGTMLPALIDGAMAIMNGLVQALPTIISVLIDSLPAIIDGVMQMVDGIVQALPEIIEAICAALPTIIPQLVEGLVSMIVTLCESFPDIIMPIIEYLPEIIISIVTALIENLPVLVEGVAQLIIGIVQALPELAVTLVEAIPTLVAELAAALVSANGALLDAFDEILAPLVDIARGKWEEIKGAVSSAWETIKNVVSVGIQFIGQLIQLAFDIITLPFRFIWENCKETILAAWEAIKGVVQAALDFISQIISTVWNAIVSFLSPILETIKNVITTAWEAVRSVVTTAVVDVNNTITTVWNAIVSFLTPILNRIKNTFTTIFNAVKTTVANVFNAVKTTVTTVINNVKTIISGGLNAAKTTVTNILNGIKQKFTDIFEKVKTTVKSGIDKIKSFFNFSWSLPKLKLPHFKISGSFSLDPPSVPSFGVEWYKKGMVLNQPTLFGVNPYTGNAMGGGEAGAEAVAPIDVLMGYVKNAVAEQNNVMVSILTKILDKLDEFKPDGNGDIIIPIYFGNELWDEIIIKSKNNITLRSGGMANA